MRRNAIIALGVVTAVMLGGAWLVTSSPSGKDAGVRERLAPDLHERINDVASVRLAEGEEEIHLARKGGDWTLASKDGYPAKFEPVKQLILAVAELRPLEPKTSNPEQYGRIEVGGPEEGGAGMLVELSDALGERIAGVVLGKTGASASFGGASTRFARNADESRAWLVEGRVDARLDPMTWIEREIVAIPADRVRAVRVERGEGEAGAVSLVKSGEQWTLQSVPEGRKANGVSDLRRVANALSYVGLSDVQAGDVPEEAAERVDATFTTGSGLDVTVTTWKEGEEYWGAFGVAHSALGPEAGGETGEGGEGEGESGEPTAEEELALLRERFSGWIFKLDSYKAESLRPSVESLTEAAAAPAGPAGPFPDVEAPQTPAAPGGG